jgi:hypothetical protein
MSLNSDSSYGVGSNTDNTYGVGSRIVGRHDRLSSEPRSQPRPPSSSCSWQLLLPW